MSRLRRSRCPRDRDHPAAERPRLSGRRLSSAACVWRAAGRADHARAHRGLAGGRRRTLEALTNRTRNKAVTILGGIMERARKVYGLPSNLVRDVEKLRERYDATRLEF